MQRGPIKEGVFTILEKSDFPPLYNRVGPQLFIKSRGQKGGIITKEVEAHLHIILGGSGTFVSYVDTPYVGL